MLRRSLLLLALAATPLAAQAPVNGDVNNDGQATATDALAVLSSLVEISLPDGYAVSLGDADCDGTVTALDAQIILAFAVELDVAQFCVGTTAGAAVAIVSVDAGTGNVLENGTLQLAATPRDSSNQPLVGRTVAWTSGDETKATVSEAGLVTGIAAGTVTITATSEGKSGSAVINVLPASDVATLTVSPRTLTLIKGSQATISASVRDGAGNPVEGNTIEWSVVSASIATVDANGVVTALEDGTTKIMASADGGALEDSAVVTVTTSAAIANRSWTGAISTDWGTAGNWQENSVPVPGDTVLIPAAAANQPVLGAGTFIGGLVIETGATLSIGANELQVSGRVDVDGTVAGTDAGRVTVQGPEGRASFVRGTLPNLSISGTTVFVGETHVAGSLELNPTSTMDINDQTVTVAKDLSIKGGLQMRTDNSILDVDGNARFFNDAVTNDAELSAGTLHVGGNFAVVVAPLVTLTPFPASGTHLLVLDGADHQVVADTGLAIVGIQKLDVSNTAGGVEFQTVTAEQRFRVNGRFSATTAVDISGTGRVNAMFHFTTVPGGSVSLLNLAVKGVIAAGAGFRPDTLTLLGTDQSIPAGAAYEYNNIVVAGSASFTGTTSLTGSMLLGCVTTLAECEDAGSVTLAGNKVTVGGDVRQTALGPSSPLFMNAATDSLVVRGGILGAWPEDPASTAFLVSEDDWTAGVLRVGGGVSVRGYGATGSHSTFLDGEVQQQLLVENGFSFQALTIADSAGVDVLDPGAFRTWLVGVRGDFNIKTAVVLSGDGRVNVSGNIQTTTGSSVTVSAISVGSVLQVAGSYAPDTAEFNNPGTAQTIQNLSGYRNVLVKGKAVFGGSMTFEGSLIVLSGAELNVGTRHVTVNGNMNVFGILRMQDGKDTLTVLGDAVFSARNDAGAAAFATAGVLRVHGDLQSDSTGFYPTNTNTVIWTPGKGSIARGLFNKMEVVQTADGTGEHAALENVVVNGTLVASAGVGPLTIDTVVVGGDALLTQADTVVQQNGVSSLMVGGSLTIQMLKLSSGAPNNLAEGNLTLLDGGYLSGTIRHKGAYVEQGTPLDVSNARPTPARMQSIRFLQQPAAVVAGEDFDPPISVELVDSAGARLVTSGVVRLSDPASEFTGVLRTIAVDGVATFPGVALKTAGAKTVRAIAMTPSGFESQPLSDAFTVSPGAPAQIVFTVQPVTAAAGVSIRGAGIGQVKVQVQDTLGNLAPYIGDIAIESDGESPDSAYGTRTIASTDGSAIFSSIQGHKAGLYTLVAKATDLPDLTSVPSDTFTVTHGSGFQLIFLVQPADGKIGEALTPLPVVQMQDPYGNYVDNYPSNGQPLGLQLIKISGPTDRVPTGAMYFPESRPGEWIATSFAVVSSGGISGDYVYQVRLSFNSRTGESEEFTISP